MKRELNLLGEVCPIPIIRARQALHDLVPGDLLCLRTDFNRTVRNLLDFCEDEGHDFEVDETGDGVWLITITKR